jgi:hypothetical protein
MQTSTICALTACAIAAYAQAQTPCDSVRIAPPSVVPPTTFGVPVAVDGDFWFIADINARVLCGGDPFGCSAGAVHVYEMVDGELHYRQMLTAPTPVVGDFFGRSIHVKAGRVAVGSLNASWPGLEAKGGAFIYQHDGERWNWIGHLRPPVGISRTFTDQLGGCVILEGDSAYISPFDREWVFRYTHREGFWEFDEMIGVPEGEPTGSHFAGTLEASGEWVFIAASDDSSLAHRGGAVYAYRRAPDGSLALSQKIVPIDVPGGPEATQLFGYDVSFDGQTLAVGAVGARRPHTSNGAVLLYELVGGVWAFQQEVTHPSAQASDGLGFPVEVYGDVLLATASGQSTATTTSSLHMFRRATDGRWGYDRQLVPNVPVFSRNFARSVATDGVRVLASSGTDLDASGASTGAAYLFDLACGQCEPDLDADGALTVFDFLLFFNRFDAGDPIADFDGDGELTIFDFLAFQTAFDAGC